MISKVGKTRSDKDIYVFLSIYTDANIEAIENFSDDDHFDAFAVFEYLALREKRRTGGNSEWYQLYIEYSDLHERFLLNNDMMQICKSRAKVHSVFDLRDHGKSLVGTAFQDL